MGVSVLLAGPMAVKTPAVLTFPAVDGNMMVSMDDWYESYCAFYWQ